jgi:hypothetical protein
VGNKTAGVGAGLGDDEAKRKTQTQSKKRGHEEDVVAEGMGNVRFDKDKEGYEWERRECGEEG